MSSFSNAPKCPSLRRWDQSQGRNLQAFWGPRLGRVSRSLTKHPGVQWFLGQHSEAAGEAQAGEGSAQIYPPIPPAPGPGARSYLPDPAWGAGVARAAGAGHSLGTGRRAGPAAASPTRWVTAAEGPERPSGPWRAARPSSAPCRTARAPRPVSGSAIFTHCCSGCGAKATGHRGRWAPRRLQAAVGLDPLPLGLMSGGDGSWRGVRVFQSSLCLTRPPTPLLLPGFPTGLEQEAVSAADPPGFQRGVWSDPRCSRGPGCSWTLVGLRVPASGITCKRVCVNISLSSGGRGSPQHPSDSPAV